MWTNLYFLFAGLKGHFSAILLVVGGKPYFFDPEQPIDLQYFRTLGIKLNNKFKLVNYHAVISSQT